MRYAVYYAPDPSTALHQLGSEWLGRDAFSGKTYVQPAPTDLAEITAGPRRYGFHATLKPPFALKEELSFLAFEVAVAALAETFTPFTIELALKQIDGFLALVPADPSFELDVVAAACVRDLDAFRRPAFSDELDRRRRVGLTPREEEYLTRWGYPYVFEAYRFHMTLSRRLSPDELQVVAPLAKAHFATVLEHKVKIDALTIFTELRNAADFDVHRRFPFQLSRSKAIP